jgi:hypothetical protein
MTEPGHLETVNESGSVDHADAARGLAARSSTWRRAFVVADQRVWSECSTPVPATRVGRSPLTSGPTARALVMSSLVWNRSSCRAGSVQ